MLETLQKMREEIFSGRTYHSAKSKIKNNKVVGMTATVTLLTRWRALLVAAYCLTSLAAVAVPAEDDDESNPCLLYLAESTIPHGKFFMMTCNIMSRYTNTYY